MDSRGVDSQPSKEETKKCHICERTFADARRLDSHLCSKSGEDGHPVFIWAQVDLENRCLHCWKKCANAQGLAAHLEAKSGLNGHPGAEAAPASPTVAAPPTVAGQELYATAQLTAQHARASSSSYMPEEAQKHGMSGKIHRVPIGLRRAYGHGLGKDLEGNVLSLEAQRMNLRSAVFGAVQFGAWESLLKYDGAEKSVRKAASHEGAIQSRTVPDRAEDAGNENYECAARCMEIVALLLGKPGLENCHGLTNHGKRRERFGDCMEA